MLLLAELRSVAGACVIAHTDTRGGFTGMIQRNTYPDMTGPLSAEGTDCLGMTGFIFLVAEMPQGTCQSR